MPDLAEILRAAGVHVVEEPGWRDRDRPGAFYPVGVMVHHTASNGDSGDVPSLNTVKRGRGDIPGPLCNLLIGRTSGNVHIISDGKANDSGMGSGKVLSETKRSIAPSGTARSRGFYDDTNGNPYYFDIEVENNGVGEAYSDASIQATAKAAAAICKAYGWNEARVIHHKEWTRRKIDMSYGGDIRGLVAQFLAVTPQPPQPQPQPPNPAPVPPPSDGDWLEEVIVSLPTLDLRNAHNAPVRHYLVDNVQGLLEGARIDVGAIDGIGGKATRAGILAFQRMKGLDQDAIIGKNTWRALITH